MPLFAFLILGIGLTIFKSSIIWAFIAFLLAIIGSFDERLNGLCGLIAIFSFFIVGGFDSNYGPAKFMAIASIIGIFLALFFSINKLKSSSEGPTTERKEVGIIDAMNDDLIRLFHSQNDQGEKPNYKAYIFGTMFALIVAFMCFMAAII